jgi:hypothetical protein
MAAVCQAGEAKAEVKQGRDVNSLTRLRLRDLIHTSAQGVHLDDAWHRHAVVGNLNLDALAVRGTRDQRRRHQWVRKDGNQQQFQQP